MARAVADTGTSTSAPYVPLPNTLANAAFNQGVTLAQMEVNQKAVDASLAAGNAIGTAATADIAATQKATDTTVAAANSTIKANNAAIIAAGGTPIVGKTPAEIAADAAAAKAQLDADQVAAAAAAKEQNAKVDAFALITDTMSTYGFNADELAQITTFIQDSLVNPKMGPAQTVLALRTLSAYKTRFAGNGTRVANGLNALSESNYIAQEDAMTQYLTTYGVGKLATRATLAGLIGSGTPATDVKTRAALAVDQVENADPQILKQLQTYYPGISKGDLTSYFLDPANTLPQLQEKVTTGQIGAAFQEQGLSSELANMTDLTKFGVTQSQAIAAAGNIETVLPTSQKLSDIYGESGIKYDQAAGQAEFLKSDAAAALKRKQLASMERAQFQGDTGVNATTGYALNNSIQGKF